MFDRESFEFDEEELNPLDPSNALSPLNPNNPFKGFDENFSKVDFLG